MKKTNRENSRNPILLGTATVIDTVRPEVRAMLEKEGLYIGTDPNDKTKAETPFVSMGGKIYSLMIDQEIDPATFLPEVKFDGPYRAKE